MSPLRSRLTLFITALLASWFLLNLFFHPSKYSRVKSIFPVHIFPQTSLIDTHCTPSIAVIRKDWNNLTHAERLQYISAVQCIQRLPSTLPPGTVPASQTLYDDFIAVHVNNTPFTHKSAIFLPWHRHYNLLFEHALHQHCHYPPHLGIPYWNWPATSPSDPSGLFSPWISHPRGKEDAPETADTPTAPAEAGEYHCLTTGPFASSVVRFGPIDVAGMINHTSLVNWRKNRPHCLARNPDWSIISTSLSSSLVEAALSAPTIDEFSRIVAGRSQELALHGWAHRAIGGQMADSFCAPADPVFWLHHSMVDRMWDGWQRQDWKGRRGVHCCENGTELFRNIGVERERVHDGTLMKFGVVGGDEVRLGDVMDTMGGGGTGYCYRYE